MTAVLIFVAGTVFVFFSVVLYFFWVTFVKRNSGNPEDVNDHCNRNLKEHKDIVRQGIEYVNSRPHKWVETVSYDGLILRGRYYDNRCEKTAIVFHGYRSAAARDFSCALQLYESLGFNVLMVDQRAHGRSEGRLITFGIKESRDVVSWVKFVTEKYAPQKILLGGMSMGATTVLLACGEDLPGSVKGVIADCGYTSPREIIKITAEKRFKFNAEFFIPFMDIFCRLFGKFSVKNVSTANAMKNSRIPVLLIHGTADDTVPLEMSERTIKSCSGKSRLLIVEGAGHGLSFLTDRTTVIKAIKEFVKCL